MASIHDIWDDPVDPPSPSHSAPKLFLSDSDDDDNPPANRDSRSRRTYRPPPQEDIDVDALFEDPPDDPFVFKPLGPSINENEIEREAEERHRNALPSTLIPILPSSSPPRDSFDRNDDSKKDANKDGKKERKRPMRLDETRLLGPDGFPRLIKQTKDFRVKGKGHEATDLNRLLQVYQFWTHSLYPKTQFRDTVQRVEKLCHSKRMHVALSVWRDEAHGKIPSQDDDDDDEDGILQLTDGHTTGHNREARQPSSAPESDAVAYASSSPPASRPPTSASEFDDDDFDIDAIIQAEQDRLAKKAPSDPLEIPDKQPQRLVRDEDEEMWNLFNDPPQAPTITAKQSAQSGPTDDDEEMWEAVHELEKEQQASASSALPLPQNTSLTDYDPDMEDMYL